MNLGDFEERAHWSAYQHAFEEMLPATSSETAPWYVIPADEKWYARAVVADLVAQRLEDMRVDFPIVPAEQSEKYTALAEELNSQHAVVQDNAKVPDNEKKKGNKRDDKKRKKKR